MVQYSEPCLICLEDIFVHASERRTKVFTCCGGFICMACAKPGRGFDKCPLCRTPIDASTSVAGVVTLAERGVSWAQKELGRYLISGIRGFQKQEKAGLEWLNKAAAQNFPIALFLLSAVYRDGLTSVVRKSQDKANELMLKAANLGHPCANSELALCYFAGMEGIEQDRAEAYFRASVSFALDNTDVRAAWVLGYFHHHEQVVSDPSLYLACY